MNFSYLALGTVATLAFLQVPAPAGIVGTYDNFDCFNDTGQETEGFEIDVEDVSCPDNTEGSPSCDLTRIFPSNFATTPWVIRYGIPTISNYDFTTATADPAHAYDQGHHGVLITYAAAWNGTTWVAPQGNAVAQGAPGVAGNGTPYNKNPTLTAGDSCWWYGLSAAYPKSGCDHFGISFGAAATPGKIAYHWKVPDPNNVGQLVNWVAETSLPPSPSFTVGAGGQVHAVAQGADDAPEARFGTAYFVKVITTYSNQDAELAKLQDVVLKKQATKKYVSYRVVQAAPAGGAGGVEDAEDDNVPPNDVQVTKQYQYYYFTGAFDGESGEAYCDTAYPTEADAIADTNSIQSGDSCSLLGNYWVNGGTPVYVKSNKGKYVGEHINAVNLQ
ncbi:MAG TPA: hypothetical protein VGP48_09220 [Stellaceae bacterium]|nr:hypothetical protein [Stellaceae bacterium]